MSEKDHVARIVKIYEAFGRGDIPYILEQLTEDVRWLTHNGPLVPWSGDFSGKTNVPKFFAAIAGAGQVNAFTPNDSSLKAIRSSRSASSASRSAPPANPA